MTEALLLDNSAWARLSHAALPSARGAEIADAIERGLIVGCLPFLLEAGYSARSGEAYDELLTQLLALPQAAVDGLVERRALEAQRQLARAGHHRLPPVDLVMAALADRHGLGVLHYDADYDVILDKTTLRYESVWLAQRGAL